MTMKVVAPTRHFVTPSPVTTEEGKVGVAMHMFNAADRTVRRLYVETVCSAQRNEWISEVEAVTLGQTKNKRKICMRAQLFVKPELM